MRRAPYYASIYNHILKQMYTGELKAGDTLPAIDVLCERYAASPNTIRTVMHKLSQEGFISTGRGKATEVVSVIGNRKDAVHKLVNQYKQLEQTFEFLCILFPAMICFGIEQMEADAYDEIYQLLDQLRDGLGHAESFRRRRSTLIHKLLFYSGNSLMMRTVNTAEEIIMLPRMVFESMRCTESEKEERQTMRQQFYQQMLLAVRSVERGDTDAAKAAVFRLYSNHQQIELGLIRRLAQQLGRCVQDAAGCNKGRDYLYDIIISDVIDKLYEGVYGAGDFLPSEGTMCERYGVSLPTVKKAYKTLTELGITRTLNGKGTQVVLYAAFIQSEQPITLERLKNLSDFLEVMQLIAVTIGDVAAYAARNMTRADIAALEKRMRSIWGARQNRNVHSIPIFLFEIVKAADCEALSLFYQELKQKLIWSVFLDHFFVGGTPREEKEWETRFYLCLEALSELEQGRVAHFGKMLSELVEHCYSAYKMYYDILLRRSGMGASEKTFANLLSGSLV